MMRCGVVKNAPNSGIDGILSSFNDYGSSQLSRRVSRWTKALACVAATLLWTGCIQSSSSNSGPLAVTANNGSTQSAVVGNAFTAPLVAVVTRGGKPVGGVSVTFTAPSSGASATFKDGATTESDTSDSNGLATSSTLTANSTSGTFNVTATASGAQSSATFSLTNVAAAQLTVVATNGSMQSATVGTAFGTALSAGVFNQGTPVSGVSVVFTAPSSGASGAFANQTTTDTEMTNSQGVATATAFTANSTVGQYVVTATASGGSPANFSLSNVPALQINITAGNSQSATIGNPFAQNLVATVLDSSNNPVSGLTVTFTAPSSGASGIFASNNSAVETQTTDNNGAATSSILTANSVVGSFEVVVSVAGAPVNAKFDLTNSPAGVAGIFPTGGVTQNAAVTTGYTSVLVATAVDASGHPFSGVPIAFAAPSSGASGTFGSNSSNTETVTTDANGLAKSSPFSANSTPGTFTVTASNGTLSPAKFLLTNTAAPVTSYAFYVSGQSRPHPTGINYYAMVGAITVDQSGNVIGGEEDYNDANGYSFVTVPISYTSNAFVIDPTTGQGTLSLNTTNSQLGSGGTETFGVQFVNSSHALIMQYDGSATSSGTLDLQNLSSPPSGSYAFTMSGTDPGYAPVALGGVFAFNGNLLHPSWPGTVDLNDGTIGVSPANVATAGLSSVDQYGHGQITGISVGSQGFTINYYQLGPEVLRIIDMDTNIAAVGSAFGQGTNAANTGNAALGNSVFSLSGSPSTGNPDSIGTTSYAALGLFTTDGAGAILSGIGDEKELGTNLSIDVDLSSGGSYNLGTNGYGTLTLPASALGNVSSLALYLTDPALNLNDPNNASGGGGGLLLDLDATLPGGTGFVVPQTDPSAANFDGTYAAGWQNLNSFHGAGLEFDILALGTITISTNPPNLNLAGLISDPFGTVNNGTPLESSSASFTSSPDTDSSHPGRYTMLGSNPNNNLLDMAVQGTSVVREFNEVVYQASGAQLFWIDVDNNGFTFDAVSYGPLQQQGSLTGIPLSRKSSGKLRNGGIAKDTQRPAAQTD